MNERLFSTDPSLRAAARADEEARRKAVLNRMSAINRALLGKDVTVIDTTATEKKVNTPKVEVEEAIEGDVIDLTDQTSADETSMPGEDAPRIVEVTGQEKTGFDTSKQQI